MPPMRRKSNGSESISQKNNLPKTNEKYKRCNQFPEVWEGMFTLCQETEQNTVEELNFEE